MARAYLFLVHGVGKHPAATWADPWKAALIEQLKRYSPYSDKKMTPERIEAEVVRFVPVGYDAVFEGYRERWGDLAGALTDTGLVAAGTVRKSLEWVAEHQSEDAVQQLFWDKVLDVLLWAAFPQARAAVMARVNEQIAKGLREMNKECEGQNTAHLLAHSLGTSVAHDSLIALRSATELHQGLLNPKRFQWNSVFMVANTSRLLEPGTDLSDDVDLDAFSVYSSALRPGSRSSIASSYFNVHHVADPITWPRRFAPADWPDQAYNDVTTLHYDQLADVHDLTTYVANPYVHLQLFRKLLGTRRLGAKEEVKQAVKDLQRDFPKQADVEFPELRALLGGDRERRLGLRQLVEFLVRAFKEVKG